MVPSCSQLPGSGGKCGGCATGMQEYCTPGSSSSQEAGELEVGRAKVGAKKRVDRNH